MDLFEDEPELTVLSFGAGQDSGALLSLYRHDPEFRRRWAPGRFLVLFADTGGEHPETYEYMAEVQKICAAEDPPIECVWLKPEMGYHAKGWMTLDDHYNTYKTVGSKAFRKSCTDRLKIQPIYSFLADYVKEWELPPLQKIYKGKAPLVAFARRYTKIQMIIGIAAGEEKRIAKPQQLAKWQTLSVDKVYPLIELGMNRAACQDYLSEHKDTVPWPSCCLKCPWMSLQELLWLSIDFTETYEDLVRQEQVKLAHFGDRDNNVGVWGTKKTLPEKLDEAREKFGHMSLQHLRAYRFSHGHCNNQGY